GYIKCFECKVDRPEKELQAFGKAFVQPGETVTIEFFFNKYSVGRYDESVSAWVADESRYDVLVGASSADIR
ncbi:hypothetical protein LTS18_006994, partial [Coniosporium uncinatum]